MNDLFFEDAALIKKDVEQLRAYQSMSNTVVIAGPGSGKTRVLTLKAITLAKNNIHKPCGLACITFSRETVRVLKKRLKQYGYAPTNKDFIGTVHSFSLLHIIQPFAHLFPQYKVHYPITILPGGEQNKIYHQVLKDLKVDKPKELSLTDVNKHRSLTLAWRSRVQIGSKDRIANAALLFERYLGQTIYIDFISIINIAATIVHEQDFVRQSLQSKFPWLLVDEYQDLGKALHEMVLELVFHAGIKLFAVGDINQSIYGFNGGYPDFLEELTGYEDITTISLSSNYRSSQAIIDASLHTLQPPLPFPRYTAEKRKEDLADFSFITCDEEMQAQYAVVAKKIIPRLFVEGIPLEEIGIITGSNEQIQHLGNFLQGENIPFFVAKWDFENSAVAVWLQDCAAWCVDNQTQSFDELFRFWRGLLDNHDDPLRHHPKIQLKTLFYTILHESASKQNLHDWLNDIVGGLMLKETLKDSEMYPNEISNIEKMMNEARLYNLKNANIARFANLGAPENEVTISTRHSCKGLEFEVVILLGMEEGNFPNYYHLTNPEALEEDQRLCYVCISRAKKTCILLRSIHFTIDTVKGPWRKTLAPSRYWTGLYEKFGTKANTFTEENY